MKLTKRQRKNIAKTLFDLSKVVAIMLLVSQFVPPAKFHLGRFVFGTIAFLVLFILAVIIDKEE